VRVWWNGFEYLPEELRDEAQSRSDALGARCNQMRSLRVERVVADGCAAYRVECVCAESARCLRIRRGTLAAALGRFERVQKDCCLT
jgi:hypothetical protein